jgi:hypothetical protein
MRWWEEECGGRSQGGNRAVCNGAVGGGCRTADGRRTRGAVRRERAAGRQTHERKADAQAMTHQVFVLLSFFLGVEIIGGMKRL